jgi:hypothetical protein
MLEIAGPDHVRFIDTPLCVYTSSGGEKQPEDYVRALLPYEPLRERPW